VLALTMPAIRDDLDGVELVGDNADAVLLGGADETTETNRVFSYMNLARAFEELEADPERTWMVGDDVDADIGGAAALGMHTILVRTGKFRDDAGAWSAQPEAVLDSIADVPAFLESAL